jgi:hypothetical protein
VVIAGAVLVSINWTEWKVKLNSRALCFMLTASFLYALTGVLFKIATIDENFWISTFWNFAGMLIVGILCFIFIKSYRRSFLKMLRESGKSLLFVNSLNEFLNLSAEILFMYAYLLVPVALVFVAESVQPAMVFMIGIILTIFFPKIIKENLSRKNLLKKSLAIILTIIGVYFLQ